MKQKWTLEEAKREAFKYSTRTEFATKSSGAYQYALRSGQLNEICQHMVQMHCKPHTKESLLAEVAKYNTIYEFVKSNKSAYNAALRLGILKEICENLDKAYWRWTSEELRIEALKYKTRMEFQRGNRGAYATARDRDILQEICVHMKKAGDISVAQKELFEFIKSQFASAKQLKLRKINILNKPHIKGFDLDVYVPEISRGIEFDGNYWHSIEGLRRSRPNWPLEDLEKYHEIKDNFFISKGIQVLHIEEKEWLRDKEKCKKRCLLFLKR